MGAVGVEHRWAAPDYRRHLYCTDALDDMLRMGLEIATDRAWAVATFDHEPALTHLVAETAWWEEDGWHTGARLSAIGPEKAAAELTWGEVRDAARAWTLPLVSRDAVAGLFLEMANTVLATYGADGYRERWGGRLAFPVRARAALEIALAMPSLEGGGFR